MLRKNPIKIMTESELHDLLRNIAVKNKANVRTLVQAGLTKEQFDFAIGFLILSLRETKNEFLNQKLIK